MGIDDEEDKMSRFFVKEQAIEEDKIYITDKEDLKHLSKVLRMTKGDTLFISDAKEYEYQVEIESIDGTAAVCTILEKQLFSREPKVKVALFQGIPKQGKMETIIQKCVELGVDKIVPVFTARTVVTDKGNFHKKSERWQKISDEAVKQCKRGIQPQVCQPLQFQEMLAQLSDFQLVLFPYENEEDCTIKTVLRCATDVTSVAIIIGPEGGFSEAEAEAAKTAGCQCVTLGKTILRTETAGMAALAMVMYELEL